MSYTGPKPAANACDLWKRENLDRVMQEYPGVDAATLRGHLMHQYNNYKADPTNAETLVELRKRAASEREIARAAGWTTKSKSQHKHLNVTRPRVVTSKMAFLKQPHKAMGLEGISMSQVTPQKTALWEIDRKDPVKLAKWEALAIEYTTKNMAAYDAKIKKAEARFDAKVESVVNRRFAEKLKELQAQATVTKTKVPRKARKPKVAPVEVVVTDVVMA